jgi:hypothetical protein
VLIEGVHDGSGFIVEFILVTTEAANPAAREKVTGNLAENTAGKIIGKIPRAGRGQTEDRGGNAVFLQRLYQSD